MTVSDRGEASRDPFNCLNQARRCVEEAYSAAQRGNVERTLERARAARDELDRAIAWLEDPAMPPDLSREIDAERDRLGMRGGLGLVFHAVGRTVTFRSWDVDVTLPQRVGLDLLRAFKPGQRDCVDGDYDTLWEIILSKRGLR